MHFKFIVVLISFFVPILMMSDVYANDVYEDIKTNPELSKLAKICPSKLVQSQDIEFYNKTSICEKNQSHCLKLCLDGSSDHCFGLANHYNMVDDSSGVYSRPLYAKSCQLGLVSGCTNAAAGLKNDYGLDEAQCYTKTFEKTCELKDPWGCTMQAVSLVYAEGTKKDLNKALTVMRGSCRFGETDRACSSAMDLASEIIRGDFD